MSPRVMHSVRFSVPTPLPHLNIARGRLYSHKVVVHIPKPPAPTASKHELHTFKDEHTDAFLTHFVNDADQAAKIRAQFRKVAVEASRMRNKLPKPSNEES